MFDYQMKNYLEKLREFDLNQNQIISVHLLVRFFPPRILNMKFEKNKTGEKIVKTVRFP